MIQGIGRRRTNNFVNEENNYNLVLSLLKVARSELHFAPSPCGIHWRRCTGCSFSRLSLLFFVAHTSSPDKTADPNGVEKETWERRIERTWARGGRAKRWHQLAIREEERERWETGNATRVHKQRPSQHEVRRGLPTGCCFAAAHACLQWKRSSGAGRGAIGALALFPI